MAKAQATTRWRHAAMQEHCAPMQHETLPMPKSCKQADCDIKRELLHAVHM